MAETPARQIADDLRARIKSGDLAPGTRLPGEPALVRQYGVAKQTAANALKLLIAEGLASARPGSGTYVREFKLIRRSATERLSRGRRASGGSVWAADVEERPLEVDALDVREAPAPEWVAEALDLSGDDTSVLVRSRRYVVDGEPVQLADSYLPAALVRGTRVAEPDTGPGGTYARLAELGAEPVDFTEELRARMPDRDEAEALSQPPGTPVIEILRVALTADGRPVEVNRMLLDAGSYVLDYRFGG
ncbi:GntR family transcriptional regulator [Streptomyces nanshensis]|uniref:GntR family transcriptional regulator n=1 Tax=Streptomyces nanshensis TaxID=518642 RepID=A0A1E7LCR9_9ACTN|nr:GntR family transcriptional regulator [Streptomyces nanshensis]OEV13901.1 GntR family transcriptional regulator [Streptomyces nanshensis]